MNGPLLELKNVTKGYGLNGSRTVVLRDINPLKRSRSGQRLSARTPPCLRRSGRTSLNVENLARFQESKTLLKMLRKVWCPRQDLNLYDVNH